ncbi:MAG TPA: hypothetical protein VI776_01855 [Anaerolineales bacterium]|nr:hypothetical protein [Anaerolineales bacterium]
MPITIVIHIQNSEPILAEMDELPDSKDTLIRVTNPRRVDGKDLHYIAEETASVIWPVEKINFIEILSSGDEESIIGFVRE